MSYDRRPILIPDYPVLHAIDEATPTGPGFIPTLAVTRPVLIDGKESERIIQKIQDGLSTFDHSGALINKTRFYDPRDWAVTYASAMTLESAFRLRSMDPSAGDMENLADRLIVRLGSELSEAGSSIPFVVGETVELGTRYARKHKLGMLAAGGCIAGERIRHSRQKRIPKGTRQILREHALCSSVLNEFIEEDGTRTLERTPFLPHISVAINKKGFTRRQFTVLSKIIRPALPPVLQLGDPILHIQTKNRYTFETIPVRSQSQHPSQRSSSMRRLKTVVSH